MLTIIWMVGLLLYEWYGILWCLIVVGGGIKSGVGIFLDFHKLGGGGGGWFFFFFLYVGGGGGGGS